jgi:hypothetical protein
MTQIKTHVSCKYFGYLRCPHRNDEIMKQATQTIPEYNGGKIPILSFSPSEEVNKICENCDMFTPKIKSKKPQ